MNKWKKFVHRDPNTWPDYSDFDEYPYCIITDAHPYVMDRLYLGLAKFDKEKEKWIGIDGDEVNSYTFKDGFNNTGTACVVTHYMDMDALDDLLDIPEDTEHKEYYSSKKTCSHFNGCKCEATQLPDYANDKEGQQ